MATTNETLTNLAGSIQLTQQAGTIVTLKTNDKYVDGDIALTLSAKTASPSFDGGELNNTSASATFTNMTTSNTDTSGIIILTEGTAGRDAVLYNGAVNGWVSKNDNTPALTAATSSTWNGTTYYATGVTLTNGKSFSITVPNGSNGTITFNFSVDSNGNTTIT